jgi:hypothetical protein
MSTRQTISRRELFGGLHTLRDLVARWVEFHEQLEQDHVSAIQHKAATEGMRKFRARISPFWARYFPKRKAVSVGAIEFCINAIQTPQARSLRAAIDQYARIQEELELGGKMVAEQKRGIRNLGRDLVVDRDALLTDQSLWCSECLVYATEGQPQSGDPS